MAEETKKSSKVALVGNSKRMTAVWYGFPFALVAAMGSGYLKLDPEHIKPFWDFIQWVLITFVGGESARAGIADAMKVLGEYKVKVAETQSGFTHTSGYLQNLGEAKEGPKSPPTGVNNGSA